MSTYVPLGTPRNHLYRRDPCPICNPTAPLPRRYQCPVCEVFGCGSRCWSCGTTDLARGPMAARQALPR